GEGAREWGGAGGAHRTAQRAAQDLPRRYNRRGAQAVRRRARGAREQERTSEKSPRLLRRVSRSRGRVVAPLAAGGDRGAGRVNGPRRPTNKTLKPRVDIAMSSETVTRISP